MPAIRSAKVAGMFYPAGPGELRRQLQMLLPDPLPARSACLGAMVPHAGYVYSGATAAAVYARLPAVKTFVLLGPNHTGGGRPIALSGAAAWETPLGQVSVRQDWNRKILERCSFAKIDDTAHRNEHSLEVQLPFLQIFFPGADVVPVCLGTWDANVLKTLGTEIAGLVQESGESALVLASSDMNHFADEPETRRVDARALEKILSLDPDGLLRVVREQNISMCGVAAAACLLWALRRLGAKQAECIRYATSAEASGDMENVVGYAGVMIL